MKKIPTAIRSMTAYGEAISQESGYRVAIQSVNRRFLEISFNLPYGFERFEAQLRKLISSFINRGQVNVTITSQPGEETFHLTPNVKLAKEIKKGWEQIAKELGMPSEFSLSLLADQKDLFSTQESSQKVSFSDIEDAVLAALKMYNERRDEEGKDLYADISKHLDWIQKFISAIDSLKSQVVESNKEKMRKKLSDLFEGDIDERVLKEAALLSEKMDISEEIVRFQALFKEFEVTLNKPLDVKDAKGKKLEFFLQELSREINTIGAKASNIEIAKHVVEIKSELEKIREQVQNIE